MNIILGTLATFTRSLQTPKLAGWRGSAVLGTKRIYAWIFSCFAAFSIVAHGGGLHPPHKPGAGVSVASPASIQLEAGVVSNTSVRFYKHGGNTGVSVALYSSEGLTVTPVGQSQWWFPPGEDITVSLNIIGQQDGRYPLMFRVGRELPNGEHIYSITGLTVQIGSKVEQQKSRSLGGVKELPADESIYY